MIAYLFRWRLRPGYEAQFAEAWTEATRALLELGSFGSALFRGPDDTWFALARWPDAQTRRTAMERCTASAAGARMDEAVLERLPPVELAEQVNLWTLPPTVDAAAG
jgi:hypothetical protein